MKSKVSYRKGFAWLLSSCLILLFCPLAVYGAGVSVSSNCSGCTVITTITGNTITGSGGTGVSVNMAGSATSTVTVTGNTISGNALGVDIRNNAGPMTLRMRNNQYSNNGKNYQINGSNINTSSSIFRIRRR